MKDILLIGGFPEIIELCEISKYNIVGIVDSQKNIDFGSYECIGTDEEVDEIFKEFSKVPIIISPDKPLRRKALVELYANKGFKFSSLISPYARISPSAQIGEGVIIQSDCNVSAKTKIKSFVKINSCANVMHDCCINVFTTIAPNAVVLGNINIGELSYVGANSTIIENLTIGDNCIIGAGAVVTKNIDSGKVVAGIPAKIVKDNIIE